MRKKFTAVLLALLTGCIEPFNPPAIDQQINILVVDGFLDTSSKTATVTLSKARPLSDETTFDNYVSGAFVQLEEEDGPTQTLLEHTQGVYVLDQVEISPGKRYRLVIQNVNDRRYLSDFVELTRSPEIDSVTWEVSRQQPGINILVNTHDDLGETQYYQWTFEETWEYTSRFGASYRLENGGVRPNELNIFRCYTTRPSTAITVGTTTQLSSNTIRNFPITFIPVGSQKISAKYSILVKQRGLSQNAYNFWVALKKSTESLGGLFDPLPSQLVGNIYAEGQSDEPVLGYFSGGETKEKRLFLTHRELPEELRVMPRVPCAVDSLKIRDIRNYPDMYLISQYGSPFPEGYTTASERNCMDCRDDGGILDRPAFWD